MQISAYTGQNRLGCSSYSITDMKRQLCMKFGAFITIRTLQRLSSSTMNTVNRKILVDLNIGDVGDR